MKNKLNLILLFTIFILTSAIIITSIALVKYVKNKKNNNVATTTVNAQVTKQVNNVIDSTNNACNFKITYNTNYVALHSSVCNKIIIINTTTLQQKTIKY